MSSIHFITEKRASTQLSTHIESYSIAAFLEQLLLFDFSDAAHRQTYQGTDLQNKSFNLTLNNHVVPNFM